MPRKYQIFVSSTFSDLKKERSLVYEVILGMGHIPVGMEYFGSRSRDSASVIRTFIDECDYQITIIGTRYGSTLTKDGVSFTEMEYDYAEASGVPQIGFLFQRKGKFVNDDEGRDRFLRLRAFRHKVSRRQVAFWEAPHQLSLEVQRALPSLFAENDRPGWVRGNVADDWLKRQLAIANDELAGVRSAIGRYRTNSVESNRRRFENNLLPSPDITGTWQCQEKSTTIDFFEYAGTAVSYCQTGTHDHWVFGLWSPERREIHTQTWRRERASMPGVPKRLTVMFGRLFNIAADSMESETFASDGAADLKHDFIEQLTWRRIRRDAKP